MVRLVIGAAEQKVQDWLLCRASWPQMAPTTWKPIYRPLSEAKGLRCSRWLWRSHVYSTAPAPLGMLAYPSAQKPCGEE